jgi:hypothetical protein
MSAISTKNCPWDCLKAVPPPPPRILLPSVTVDMILNLLQLSQLPVLTASGQKYESTACVSGDEAR